MGLNLSGFESTGLLGRPLRALLAALRHAKALLARRKPVIVLATHGAEIHDLCCRLLTGLGYDLTSLDNRAIASTDELLATSGRLT